jgi:exodeoxyribonuclease X
MPKTIIFDTETTGKNDPKIIEAAWLELTSIKPFTIVDGFCERYNPGKPIELGALATHHILDEELTNCKPTSEFKLPSDVEYIIGHNVDYDWNVSGNPDVKRICTLALSRNVWPKIDSHTQSALMYHLDRSNAREQLKNAHSALADVGICALIVENICAALNIETVEQLWLASESARIPTVIPFGKHKGTPLSEVPSDYKQWLLGQSDLDPYLKKALIDY